MLTNKVIKMLGLCNEVSTALASAGLHKESKNKAVILKPWLLCGKKSLIFKTLRATVACRDNTPAHQMSLWDFLIENKRRVYFQYDF